MVSVVMPVHNTPGRYLTAAIESALAQTYPHLEVIVVDDGSTAPVRTIAEAYGDRVRYVAQDHQGPSSARNRGIRFAKGEYIAFLDADDLWEPDKIETQVGLLEREPRTGLVHAAVTRIDKDGQPCPGGESRRPGRSGRIAEALFMQNFIGTSTVVARKACFDAVGLFDGTEGAVPGQDYDMWLRIAERYDVAFVARPLATYRVHAAGISKRIAQAYEAERAVVDRALERHGGPRGEWRRLVRRRYGQLHFEWGYDHFSNGEHREARTQFWESLRWAPWRVRTWGYWLSMCVPKQGTGPVAVLHVLNTLEMGGAEQVVLNLARHLDRDRFAMQVCGLGGEGPLAEEFRRLGVQVHAMHRRPGIDLRLGFRLARLLRRERISVVHTHNAGPWLYGSLAAKLTGARLVHTEHSNLFPHQQRLQRVEWWLARLTDVIIADSEKVKRQLVEGQGVSASRIRVVVNGVDTRRFTGGSSSPEARQALHVNGAGLVIGTVGRLVPVKDHRTLLEAFRRVAEAHPAYLVLVGDGPLRGELVGLAGSLGIGERVRFLGERQDIPAILPAFDLFVLSSVSEGMPLTILEAMAAGKPVVATTVGGIPEAVVEGETGLLVPPRDPERLAQAMLRLLADEPLRAACGRAGSARVRERFDLRQMVETYESAYHHEPLS